MVRKMGLDAGGRTEGIQCESLRKRIQGRGGGIYSQLLAVADADHDGAGHGKMPLNKV